MKHAWGEFLHSLLPHARLDTGGLTTAPRKQSVRMLKCECQACGYTVRTARKWLETAGAPQGRQRGAERGSGIRKG